MRSILTTVVLLLAIQALSQNEIQKGVYRFTSDEMSTYSPQIDTLSKTKYEIHSGHKIKVLHYSGNNGGTVYYRYLTFNDTYKVHNKKFWKVIPYDKEYKPSEYANQYNDCVFKMSASSFKLLTQPIYNRYKGASMGIYTVPFRIRDIGGDNFDFETSLSLQSNLIFGWGSQYKENSWFDASCGIGITGITLDSRNSNLADTVDSRTASALTISLGTVFKPNATTSIGFFLGWDFLGAKDKEVEWVHQGKAWLGVGIGISLTPIKSEKPTTKKEKQNI